MTSQRTATKKKSLYHYVLIFVFRSFTYTCLLFSVCFFLFSHVDLLECGKFGNQVSIY